MTEPRRPRRVVGPLPVLITGVITAVITVLAGCAVPVPMPVPTRESPSPSGSSGTPTTAPTTIPSATPTGPQVVLDESFDSGELDQSVWNTCYWWDKDGCTISSNNELQWYRPQGVQISNGALNLVAERGDQRGSDGKTYPFRSGMVTTGPPEHDAPAKLSFTYGTVEARLRVPSGKGLWSAMWLLPADEESRPEIDVLEILGNDPRELLMHFHPRDRSADSPAKTVKTGVDFSAGWHDFRLDWTPEHLDYIVDGQRVWRVSGDQVPDEPMYLIFNLAVGGVYPGDPDDSTQFPATFAIDHVTITTANRS